MEKILMVEDEVGLRDWFEAILRETGRDVEWITSGELAQQILSDSSRRWDLIVSDFDLHSKLTGLDLWHLSQARQPETPFLLISGVPDHIFHSMVRSGEACPDFLLKPFGAREFQETLSGLLLSRPLLRAG